MRGPPDAVRNLVGAAWFLAVFLVGLVWFFPVREVVTGQVRGFEQQAHVRINWSGEQWSLWRSRLDNVTVSDHTGHVWIDLRTLDLRPRFGAIYVQGQAAWGGINAIVRNGSVVLEVDGYPIPRPPRLQFDDGRLRAQVEFEQAKFKAHGSFSLSGRINIGIYAGPIDLSGTFELTGAQGLASIEILGDKLRGRGDITVDATGTDWSHARISGPMRVEQHGAAQSLTVGGEVGNLTIQTTQ